MNITKEIIKNYRECWICYEPFTLEKIINSGCKCPKNSIYSNAHFNCLMKWSLKSDKCKLCNGSYFSYIFTKTNKNNIYLCNYYLNYKFKLLNCCPFTNSYYIGENNIGRINAISSINDNIWPKNTTIWITENTPNNIDNAIMIKTIK